MVRTAGFGAAIFLCLLGLLASQDSSSFSQSSSKSCSGTNCFVSGFVSVSSGGSPQMTNSFARTDLRDQNQGDRVTPIRFAGDNGDSRPNSGAIAVTAAYTSLGVAALALLIFRRAVCC
ncbi:uncharacterized protein LOC129597435 [Paramacrobiotus metropolitanus]|uniref:uncharacterized protein LOC129597435 n=1 Tax=Paramacrobiotus metropolitanus TaxID=2943436 RepID=UPI00244637F6|nr:uncharacterized protein LOC129597435 [Paramacrobiotus metropolitanus]